MERLAEYTTSGATINASLISFTQSTSLALDGNGDLFEASANTGTIGEYTTSGAAINASLISALSRPLSLVLDGKGDLFVLSLGTGRFPTGTIGEYNATSGTAINASLISELTVGALASLALDGNGDLFVANSGNGTIGEYNATSGATINASLISGLTTLQLWPWMATAICSWQILAMERLANIMPLPAQPSTPR